MPVAFLGRNIVWVAVFIVLGLWSTQTAAAAESPAGIVEGARVGEVSVGADHACAIRTTGDLVCWGDNSQQEGTPPAGLFVQVSAGTDFTCAIRDDGTLACWGADDHGQTAVPTGLYRELSAGADHACAIRDDGVALCWGADTGTIPDALFIRLAAGDGFTCGLVDGFTLACWGANDHQQAEAPSGHYSQLSAGANHACAIRDDGLPQCWGNDANGKATPAPGVFVQLSAGMDRTCGVREDGVALCWGAASSPPSALLLSLDVNDGACGLQGDGTLTCWNRANLQAPPSGTFTRRVVETVLTGASCVIKENGVVECWNYPHRANPLSTNPMVHLDLNAYGNGSGIGCGIKLERMLSCWGFTTTALTPTLRYRSVDGDWSALRVCGVTTHNTLLCNATGAFHEPFPAQRFTDVITNQGYVCGLKSDGQAVCRPWNQPDPSPTIPADRRYIQLTGWLEQVCGLKTDGTVECWPTTGVSNPSLAAGRYIQVSSSSLATCGLRSDHFINCTFPESVPSERYTSVSIEGFNACGMRIDTLIECWGRDTDTDLEPNWLQYFFAEQIFAIPIGVPIQKYTPFFGAVAYRWSEPSPLGYQVLDGQFPDGIFRDTTSSFPYSHLTFDLTGTTTLTTQQFWPSVTMQVTDKLGFVETKPFTVIVAHQPVADAGLDQQVARSSTVQLNGTDSHDPLNTPSLPLESYIWTQTGGPVVQLSGDGRVASPTFTAPATDAVLTFQLQVLNGYWILSYPDTVTIIVGNPPPSNLQAGVVLPAVTSESVSFTATAQGQNITYAWSFGDGGTANGATPTHTYAAPGTYTAIVTATNSIGSVSRTLSVPVRSRPVAHAGTDIQTTVGMPVTLDGTASSDPANDSLQYGWQQTSGPAVVLTNPFSNQPSFVAPSQPATLDFTLVVTNSSGLVDASPDSVRITIHDSAINGLHFTTTAPHGVGETTAFTAAVAAGSNVSYAWDFGDGATGGGITTTHSYANPGAYGVTLTATNSQGSQSVTHTVTIVQTKWRIYAPYLTKPSGCPPVCGLQQALGRAFGH